MRRLNVRLAQLEQCIRLKKFALSSKPQKPALYPGEILLLSLVLQDAMRTGKASKRIEWCMKFDVLEEDVDGSKSREYWPSENRTWQWILNCFEVRRVARPFSLSDLKLSKDYGGQDNPRTISRDDEPVILPYLF